MDDIRIFERYQEIQTFVGWTRDDADRVRAVGGWIQPWLPDLADAFCTVIDANPRTSQLLHSGPYNFERLRGLLLGWMSELFEGPYDESYVKRRWRVGWRHVEIGLDQVYTSAALSSFRSQLIQTVATHWPGPADQMVNALDSINRHLDLDLALIGDAYQEAHNARLQTAERLATLGQVAGGVAHELRNPLNVIKTSVFYLQNAREVSPQKQAEHLDRIARNVDRANAVITALSNFARMPAPRTRETQVMLLVQDALSDNHPGPHIQVETLVEPEHLQIPVDPEQFKIVVGNLVRNAADVMREGGLLQIRAHPAAGEVRIEVADTGPGIPAEILARIFEPLYSTKERGLGLGLSITRLIVEKHRGTLEVHSHPGQGSRFTIRIPATSGVEGPGDGRPLDNPTP